MILDSRLLLSDAQPVSTTAISSVIDLGATPVLRAVNDGGQLDLRIQVAATVLSAGAATVTFSLETSHNASLAGATVMFQTGSIPRASLVAGATAVHVALPAVHFERFLGVRYTVASGPLTAGAFTAALV